jgi:Tfp pilus assembly protein PilX
MTITHRLLDRARSQEGVTIVIAMGVMLVTSLLLAGAFVATQDDIGLSHTDTMQKQAYYAALAGVQEFEYKMQVNPNYWQTCAKTTNTLPQEKSASYTVKILPAAGASECSTSSPITSVIESKGAAANTFRIESVGTAGANPEQHHTIIATFKVTGFLNFIYYTNHEDEDPSLYNASTICSSPNTFYPTTSSSGCQLIQFATGDSINGPVHTNDAACIGGSASFGRSGHSPLDVVEFYGGVNSSCHGTGTFYTATKSYIKGEDLPPPTSDKSLETYAATEDKLSGVTDLVLEGATNEIAVTNASVNGGVTKKFPWPSNGLIYVTQTSGACGYTYKPYEADNSYEASAETNCGNVYVHGTYSKPLTIGASDDVIINGEIYPYGNKGGTPSGTATLGLIANNFVRVYHPVKQTYEGSGPELETAHNLKLESAAHKETITVTAKPGLGEEIKLEVKNQGSQFEVVVHNESGSKTLEKTALLSKASQLVGLASSYVVYGEGAKYSEGATEKLKSLGAESLGHPQVIRIKPKSPNLGKEMKVEVKENTSGTENEVILLNANGEQLEKITGIKEARSLLRSTTNAVYEKGSGYNSSDEKEKLRITAGAWLDESCEQNGKGETEKFDSTARECDYTDSPEECDAPSLSEKEDTLHGWGTLEDPWIYTAILATTHSFVVDNFNCGPKALGELHLDGALAQNYRGIVGTGGSTINTGYLKDYKYDERLAVDEPPYFLSPLNAGWKVARETSPSGG